MASTITEKTKEDRVREVVNILRDIAALGIPLNSPEVADLRTHLDAYVKDGICWDGTINFMRFGRMADVILPRRADKAISINLRQPRASR
jgi:hypothetical protein